MMFALGVFAAPPPARTNAVLPPAHNDLPTGDVRGGEALEHNALLVGLAELVPHAGFLFWLGGSNHQFQMRALSAG
jgi:hypothetical protein